ncbi:MAG: hypothetical protein LBO74_06920 [Candidatus Symbiothrix sp.]|jgi:hypothetical protein|nr:hypothetical protein [Candidatus Symbiothrix sp.]
MKTLLKFLLLVICLTFIFILLAAVLPYSQTIENADGGIHLSGIVYLVINSLWICLAIFYVAKKSPLKNDETIGGLSFSLFFIYAFMPQIEPLLFKNTVLALDRIDVLFIMIVHGISVVLATLLGVRLFRGHFKPSRYTRKSKYFSTTDILIKLLLTGVSYMVIYFVFEYFVTWKIEEVRIFYTGSSQDVGFVPRLIEIWNHTPSLYFVQLARGVLFGLFILPVVNMFRKKSLVLLISIILIFESSAISLIIPNLVYPEVVRTGHLWEMISSLFLFAIITWLVFDKLILARVNDKYY